MAIYAVALAGIVGFPLLWPTVHNSILAGVAAALVRLAGGKPATEGQQAPRRPKKEKSDAQNRHCGAPRRPGAADLLPGRQASRRYLDGVRQSPRSSLA